MTSVTPDGVFVNPPPGYIVPTFVHSSLSRVGVSSD